MLAAGAVADVDGEGLWERGLESYRATLARNIHFAGRVSIEGQNEMAGMRGRVLL